MSALLLVAFCVAFVWSSGFRAAVVYVLVAPLVLIAGIVCGLLGVKTERRR